MEELLAKIGLSRFAATFAAEEVDLEVVGLFAESDFADLGLPKGPRVKLLRAIKDVFAAKPPPAGPREIEAVQATVEKLQAQVGSLEGALATARGELSDLSRHRAERDQAAAAADRDQASKSTLAATNLKQQLQQEVGLVRDQMTEISEHVRIVQELAPSRLCWQIKHCTEKILTFKEGKWLRAPPFALCGFLAGIKLDFYPSGRDNPTDSRASEDDGHLPEITPRPHPALRSKHQNLVPEEGLVSIGVCCPMGIKLQYHLQVGHGNTFDFRNVEWTPVYHDFRVSWREELEGDDSLTILLTVVRIHNRRYKVQGDTVFVRAE